MKTITKTYKIYSYEELSDKAKQKALSKWNEDNDYTFLQDNLREYIHEELKNLGFKILGVSTSKNPTIQPYYSLSYCQGDGLMFEGILQDKKCNTYTIKQQGHYFNERSTQITGTDKNDNEIDTKDFEENIYIPLCKKIRDIGYEEIEYEDSEENFIEICNCSEYTFLEDGTMFNK